MRYIFFATAILLRTPVNAAEFTDTIELQPGFGERWEAPRPFTQAVPGNSDVVQIIPGKTDREIIVVMKSKGGSTNILFTDDGGKVVANVRIASPTPEYQLARSVKSGAWQYYQRDEKCYPACARVATPTQPVNKAEEERADTGGELGKRATP